MNRVANKLLRLSNLQKRRLFVTFWYQTMRLKIPSCRFNFTNYQTWKDAFLTSGKHLVWSSLKFLCLTGLVERSHCWLNVASDGQTLQQPITLCLSEDIKLFVDLSTVSLETQSLCELCRMWLSAAAQRIKSDKMFVAVLTFWSQTCKQGVLKLKCEKCRHFKGFHNSTWTLSVVRLS